MYGCFEVRFSFSIRRQIDHLNAHKAPHPGATGQGDVMYCTRDPKVGTLVFFVLCLNIRRILQKEQKSGKTATEKEKSPYWLQICNSKGREETVY